MTAYKKKLIEVALPLEAINRESAREKSIRHGHPSTLHLWWARRPLATCRAVLFASLVDDPSAHPDEFPTEDDQEKERQRLFRIIEELVKWENSTNEDVLSAARAEILRSTDGDPPPVLDPFCGGGSIPLEAQRLGLEAHASDLNPVAVLITKALIEIPPRFAGLPPVNPASQAKLGNSGWRGAQGLAEDVRYYGRWMRDRAEERIGHLYPKVKLPPEYGGGEATVIAWLWARTVKCPNPACGAEMPLVRSFALSTKKGKQAWVEPIVDHAARTVRFAVRTGTGVAPEGTVNRQGARCIVCGSNVPFAHVRREGQQRGLGVRLMAIVAEGQRGRVYVAPNDEHMRVAESAQPGWKPDAELPHNPRDFKTPNYGMTTFADLFTDRQLVALTTFSDLVAEAREQVLRDTEAAIAAGSWAGTPAAASQEAHVASGASPSHEASVATGASPSHEASVAAGASPSPAAGSPAGAAGPPVTPEGSSTASRGPDATASGYADAVTTYLAFALSKMADRGSTICTWFTERDSTRNTFARQAIPMTWDFAELNTLLKGTGSFEGAVIWTAESLDGVPLTALPARARQLDAASALDASDAPMISTDPPYYDNIGYADLSDFFYVWLRRSLSDVYPDLFSTLLVPKAPELVATPYRFEGDKKKAREFFERRLGAAFERMRTLGASGVPLTVYYAFKQAETDNDGDSGQTASTGWETMLAGLLKAGFSVAGTWPMRSELSNRPVASGTNALASSVVLVCRPRHVEAPLASRREFLGALKAELPGALRHLQHGNIAPVDLAQASIGPGMAVFSRYAKVVEADGSTMSVRTALALINDALDEVVAEQEGEFDADTRWAIAWFDQHGMVAGPFGDADNMSRAKNTSVQGMVEAGFLEAKAGKVRLLARDELDPGWDPATDKRLTVWEMTQHLIRRLDEGEAAAAALARHLGSNAEVARDLAYRLYLVCERKKWSREGQAYNGLVVAWPQIVHLAASPTASAEPQTRLDV